MEALSKRRWQCGTCGKWHTGLPLDVGFKLPDNYLGLTESQKKRAFANTNFCAIPEDQEYFVRGLIALPIIGLGEEFRYGVWSSLSKKNFDYSVEHWNDPNVEDTPIMFGWLNSRIPGYPDTRDLKLDVQLKNDTRPYFHIQKTGHPLWREQHEGITLSRVEEIVSLYH